MNSQLIVRLIGYLTAGVVLIAGIAVILGFVLPAFVPESYRVMFGVVFIVYGVYRSVMIWIKRKKEISPDAEE